MHYKAIDIVLLPEVETKQTIIEIHKKLDIGKEIQKIDIADKCLPHISLAMGGLKEKDAEDLFDITSHIGKEIKNINLAFTHISQHQNSKGENINSLEHMQSTALSFLHEKLIEQTRKILVNKVDSSSFSGEENVTQDSINWVNDYFTTHSLENFNPHITLGTGSFTEKFKQFNATFKRLAICHLGNYCTCRTILFETQLAN